MWLDLAKTVPQGQHIRSTCDNECGTPSMNVYHSPTTYSAYCFRCGTIGWRDKGYQTLEDIQKSKAITEAAYKHAQSHTLSLPSDSTSDVTQWPSEALVWLLKAGIYGKMITDARIQYSAQYQRVVLPIYKDNVLIYYQLRGFNPNEAKYINPSVDRSNIYYSVLCNTDDDSSVVIVEDILSCIRVGQVHNCVSLLGTKISTQQASYLSNYDKVYTWLDPDEAGIHGAYQIGRALALTTDVVNITSSVDPKFLTNKEISERLI